MSDHGPGMSPPAGTEKTGRSVVTSLIQTDGRLTQLAPISAIVPTKNRPEDLRRTIRTLLEETVLPGEVVIVDQSLDQQSFDAVHDEFRKAAERLRDLPALRYIHDTSIRGLSAARNAGMEAAQQPIWLFLDDDIIMEPDFSKELMRAYTGSAPADGASGVITNYSLPDVIYRSWLKIFARGPFVDERQPIYWHAENLRNAGLIRVALLSGGLMSFRAEIVRNLPFDVRASDCQCEDFDYCVTLGSSAHLVIVPSARLKHMTSPKDREARHWIRRIALSFAFLFKKHFSGRGVNRLRFCWMCLGLALLATTASLRRFSLEPWRTYITSVQEGFRAGRESHALPPAKWGSRTSEFADPK